MTSEFNQSEQNMKQSEDQTPRRGTPAPAGQKRSWSTPSLVEEEVHMTKVEPPRLPGAPGQGSPVS